MWSITFELGFCALFICRIVCLFAHKASAYVDPAILCSMFHFELWYCARSARPISSAIAMPCAHRIPLLVLGKQREAAAKLYGDNKMYSAVETESGIMMWDYLRANTLSNNIALVMWVHVLVSHTHTTHIPVNAWRMSKMHYQLKHVRCDASADCLVNAFTLPLPCNAIINRAGNAWRPQIWMPYSNL